ncbi:polyketide beta-ketoacyl:ACP synthase [Streptomyces sp. NBC_01485]|uniref:beta-ketoacyl synthase N-terminal-like domain-containing protein n=1 Tax=Streptomyces sp. NBC_01485 TaxID=2903884 RepID=UPI002E2F6803|nr:beta-ketoacyl synthase N-terminal-like domain-containing protein [Streptomyces sp. NBC_01485]
MTARHGVGRAVITGLGVRCAIGTGLKEFTESLRSGRSGIRPPDDRHPDEPGAPLPPYDFAAELASRGEPQAARAARTAARSPAAVQSALLAALEAWTHAGLAASPLPGDRVALVIAGNNLTGGTAHRTAERYRGRPDAVPGRYALHMQDTDHVGVVSEVLGITGEGCTVGGASASGNLALITAARTIAAGGADACLVVGTPAELTPMERQAYRALGAMAVAPNGPGPRDPDPLCRPFDTGHRGFTDGAGAAAVLLESAESARRRGARVLAGLAGYGWKLSGTSLADPSEDAEVEVMRTALARAGTTSARLGYVNTHGTASPLGDRTEAAALMRVLDSPDRVWVNATKALTGHCLSAAGVVEAVATVAQLNAGFVHPNPYLTDPIEPRLRFTGAKAMPAESAYALSNSFGFGGFHSAVVFADEGA